MYRRRRRAKPKPVVEPSESEIDSENKVEVPAKKPKPTPKPTPKPKVTKPKRSKKKAPTPEPEPELSDTEIDSENEVKVPAKKPKPTPKRKTTKADQKPKSKRSEKKVPTPEPELSESEIDSENESMDIEPDEQKTNFMAMNDDCIREIFEYLNASELCALGTQCRRLQQLAKLELYRRFPNIFARIVAFEDNNYWFRYPDADPFIICFAQFKKLSIRNSVSDARSIANLKAFIKTKEKSFVEEIHFDGCRTIRASHGKALAELFEKTKSVTFNRCKIRGEFHDAILQHFPAMEHLMLWNSFEMACKVGDESNWLKFEYPNLKSFSWFLDQEIVISDEMKMFFVQNKTIKHFSLLTRQIETVEKCAEAGIKITHLYYRITRDVATILEYLKKLCRKKKSLRLHLLFADGCRSNLTGSLKLFGELKNNLRGLYLEGTEPSKSLAEAIGKCIQLKNLQVQYCKNVELYAALPKLENVYMSRGMVQYTTPRIRDTMFQFATHAPKLRNLFFRNSCTPFCEFDFANYNAERAKLPAGATKLTLHVRTKADARIQELARMQTNYDMVSIKRIDREDLAYHPLANDWLYRH